MASGRHRPLVRVHLDEPLAPEGSGTSTVFLPATRPGTGATVGRGRPVGAARAADAVAMDFDSFHRRLSTSDIADALGCTGSTATSHLHQARARLAQILGDADHRERTDRRLRAGSPWLG